jgi:hypothetical protein
MEYRYKVKITGNREVYLKELTVEDYKNLQKTCIESDLSIFEDYIGNMISELSDINMDELNILDIYILVLEIKRYSVSGEKTFTTYVNGKRGGVEITIDELIDPVIQKFDKLQNGGVYELELDDFFVDSIIFDPFSKNDVVKSYIKDGEVFGCDNISDLLPVYIKKQIDDKISCVYKEFSNIVLFTLTTESGDENNICFNLNKNYIYDFLKVMIKDDLKSFYKNVFDMKSRLNIGFNEHQYMTISEMGIYINMFNKEQEAEQEKERENKHPIPV